MAFADQGTDMPDRNCCLLQAGSSVHAIDQVIELSFTYDENAMAVTVKVPHASLAAAWRIVFRGQ